MFRSVSTKMGPRRYERLDEDASSGEGGFMKEELKRSTSVPPIREMASASTSTSTSVATLQRNPTKKVSKEKSHPIFRFLDFRRKKKTTATPELVRYLEYVKEGGIWDSDSNKPVIYYK